MAWCSGCGGGVMGGGRVSDSSDSLNCMWPVYSQDVFAYFIFKRQVENQTLPSNTEERKVVVAEIQGQHWCGCEKGLTSHRTGQSGSTLVAGPCPGVGGVVLEPSLQAPGFPPWRLLPIHSTGGEAPWKVKPLSNSKAQERAQRNLWKSSSLPVTNLFCSSSPYSWHIFFFNPVVFTVCLSFSVPLFSW